MNFIGTHKSLVKRKERFIIKRAKHITNYIECKKLGDYARLLKSLNFNKKSTVNWEDIIQGFMVQAQISLFKYELLDPKLTKKLVNQYIKESLS